MIVLLLDCCYIVGGHDYCCSICLIYVVSSYVVAITGGCWIVSSCVWWLLCYCIARSCYHDARMMLFSWLAFCEWIAMVYVFGYALAWDVWKCFVCVVYELLIMLWMVNGECLKCGEMLDLEWMVWYMVLALLFDMLGLV